MARPSATATTPSNIKYIIEVLWLQGSSARSIIAACGKVGHEITERAVRSISDDLGHSNLGAKLIEDRQVKLDALRYKRLDMGVLKDWCFKAVKVRKKISMPKVVANGQVVKAAAKSTGAKFTTQSTETIVYFQMNPRVLKDGFDNEPMARRIGAAFLVQEKLNGRDISTLQSVDFINSEVSGGFGPKSPGDYSIDCMKAVSHWQRDMPANVWQALERCFWENNFIFLFKNGNVNNSQLDLIKLGLDIVCHHQKEIDRAELLSRWREYRQWVKINNR